MEDLVTTGEARHEGELDILIVRPRHEDAVAHVEETDKGAVEGQVAEAQPTDAERTDLLTDDNGDPIKVNTDPFDQADKPEKKPAQPTVYEALNQAVAPFVEQAFFGEGDESRKAFGQIFAKLAPTLLRHRILHGLPNDVQEDLVQDTFIRALRAREGGSFKNVDNIAGWFSIILTNLAKDRYRKSQRAQIDTIDTAEYNNPLTIIEAPSSTEENIIANDSLAKLYAAIRARAEESARNGQEVTTDWVDVLHMIDVEGLSYDEFAKLRGLKRATVGSRLFRARQKAREILAEQGITSAK